MPMSETQKTILELGNDGMDEQIIADTLEVSKKYVQQTMRERRREDEGLGGMSILDKFREIVLEVSKTSKIDAILRKIADCDPDDIPEIARALKMAGLPKSDIMLIVENWSNFQETAMPSDLIDEVNERMNMAKDRLNMKGKRSDRRKGRRKINDDEEEEDDLDAEIKKLEKMSEKEQQRELKKMQRESAMLSLQEAMVKRKQRIDEMQGKGKEEPVQQQVAPPPRDIVIRRRPVEIDDPDNPGKTKIIYVQDEIPMAEYNRSLAQDNQQSMGPKELMEVFKLAIDTVKVKDDGGNNNTIDVEDIMNRMDERAKRREDKLKHELEMQRLEFQKKIDEKENEQKWEVRLREEREQWEEKLKSFDKDGPSEKERNVQMQKTMIDEGSEKLRETGMEVKEDVKELVSAVLKNQIENDKQERYFKRIERAKKLGIEPSDVEQRWENDNVPEVSDAELMRSIKRKKE